MAKPIKLRPKKRSGPGGIPYKILGGLQRMFFASLPYVFTLTVIGLLFGGAIAWAMNLPVFQLAEVKILNIGSLTPDQSFAFCELHRGENLIRLDLVGVQQVIKRKHPEFKEVRVCRVLPNRVEIILKRRTPAAQVAFSRFVQIDRDMVILPGSAAAPFRNLLVVEGVRPPFGGVLIGNSLKDTPTKKALALADLIHRLGILKKHVLSKINVSDIKNITIFVDQTIEIRMGESHFEERLKILGETLKNVDLDPAKINYIDLRFDDVVIGPR